MSTQQLNDLVTTVTHRREIGAGLLRAMVRKESAGHPCAVSKKGARGILRLMPATARALGVTDITDPLQNLDAGVRYLKQNLKRYNNDLKLALAAYNAGPGAIDKYSGVPPFPETQNYVQSIVVQARD